MRVTVIFPGQGSQRVGMGKEDFEKDPRFKSNILKADEVLGYKLSKIMFEGPESELTLTQNAQPAIFAVSYCLFEKLLEKLEERFSGKLDGRVSLTLAGHSLGEWTAVACAGAMSFEDCVKAVHLRGKYMQEAVPEGKGKMYAVISKLKAEDIQNVLVGKTWIANINSTNQVVISGEAEDVERSVEKLKGMGAKCIPLKVSAPFHCPLMKPAKEKLEKDLRDIKIDELKFGVISAHTLEYYTRENVKSTLLEGITMQVNWLGVIRKLENQTDVFVEVGWGNTLTGLCKKITTKPVETINKISDIEKVLQKIFS